MKSLPIIALALVLFQIVLAVQAAGAPTSRPFWTEKSSFVEGDELFVVGVASHVKTPEEGRQKAFEHGMAELMNYAQVTDLEAQGLVIETQMTYEEQNPDGTVTVYRLFRVPAAKLVAIQGHLKAKSQAQVESIEKARQELLAIQESVSQKQQELEARSRAIQQTLNTVSQLQATLNEKALKIEQQHRQVEQLLQQLNVKVQGGASSLDALKQAEVQLDEQERELKKLYGRIADSVRSQSNRACKYVLKGMKQSQVRELLGEPDGRRTFESVWDYGSITIYFRSHGGVVSSISGCASLPVKIK